MSMHRLMVCTTVSICLLSTAASAVDRSHKSPFKGTPLAAPHHASYSHASRKSAAQAKVEKPVKKVHFWNK